MRGLVVCLQQQLVTAVGGVKQNPGQGAGKEGEDIAVPFADEEKVDNQRYHQDEDGGPVESPIRRHQRGGDYRGADFGEDGDIVQMVFFLPDIEQKNQGPQHKERIEKP